MMGNQSGRQRVQIEVAHSVTAHNHRCLLLMEGSHDSLQCLGGRIKIITVQLYGKSAASLIIDGHVPASAYSQVLPVGHDMYQHRMMWSSSGMIGNIFLQQLWSTVEGMIIHHDYVISEVGLLRHGTVHRIYNRLLAVEHGD